jgi:3'-phosphoadenosine 5'-phosphosulfate sulfotransferase (PAPS reductase)/FAD synthetase
MRCPSCGGLVVYDRERGEFVCALCESVVTESTWPYPPEYMKAVYIVKTSTKEKKAREVIRKYSTANTAVALSGKDSITALHLAVTAGVAVDVVIGTHVADRRLPQKIVDELRAVAESLGARRIIIHDEPWDIHASLFVIISRTYGYDAIITGLRRRENRGNNTVVEYYMVEYGRVVKVINPIIDWTVAEVWSYIYNYRLPVITPYRDISRPETPLQHFFVL